MPPGFFELAFESRGMMFRDSECLRESEDARAEVFEDEEGKLMFLAMSGRPCDGLIRWRRLR